MDTKPLYQPWQEEVFLADEHVQAMTPIQRWMYRTLLQKAFVCKDRPYLPADDKRLWLLAGCATLAQWQENKELVLEAFDKVTMNGVQYLHRKRLVRDYDRVMNKREQMAENARAKAEQKQSNCSTDAPSKSCASAGEVKGSEVKRSEVKGSKADAAATPLSEQGRLQEGQPGYYAEGQWSFLSTPQKVLDRMRQVWQGVIGKAAMFRKPQGKGWEWFTDVCGQLDPDVLIPAFELWVDARGKFNPTDSPIFDFLKDDVQGWAKKVSPLNDYGTPYVEPTFTDEEKHQQREQHLKNFNATLPELEAQLQDLIAGLNMFRGGMSPECIANDEAQIKLLEKMIAEEREYIARREQTQAGRAA
jgi:hypothetical protein